MAICIWNSFDKVNFESHVKKKFNSHFQESVLFQRFFFVKDDPWLDPLALLECELR